jgi:hypothetical protein
MKKSSPKRGSGRSKKAATADHGHAAVVDHVDDAPAHVEAPAEPPTVHLESMPKELGVLMLVVGVGGVLLPGPIGTPFLVAGGVILWPSAFRRVDRALERRCPRLHRAGLAQIHRFIIDLERRYPTQI